MNRVEISAAYTKPAEIIFNAYANNMRLYSAKEDSSVAAADRFAEKYNKSVP